MNGKTIRIWAAVAAVGALAGCGGAARASPPAASTPPPPPAAAAASPDAGTLAARLQAAGIPVKNLIVYDAATDPNHLLGRQGGYTSKVAWEDPRAIKGGASDPAADRGGTEFGGGIEVFATTNATAQRAAYLRAFSPPFGDGYDYVAGTAILRLSQYLTPAQAQGYRAAFEAAVHNG